MLIPDLGVINSSIHIISSAITPLAGYLELDAGPPEFIASVEHIMTRLKEVLAITHGADIPHKGSQEYEYLFHELLRELRTLSKDLDGIVEEIIQNTAISQEIRELGQHVKEILRDPALIPITNII